MLKIYVSSRKMKTDCFGNHFSCLFRLATSLFPDNTKRIKLRLKMKNQEGEKLEEEGNLFMLPSDMKLKIKTGKIRGRGKIFSCYLVT